MFLVVLIILIICFFTLTTSLFYRIYKNKVSIIVSLVMFLLFLTISYFFITYFNSFYYLDCSKWSVCLDQVLISIYLGFSIYFFLLLTFLIHLLRNYKYIKILKITYSIFRIYFIICIFVFIYQDKLLFFPPKADLNNINYLKKTYKNLQTISIKTSDNNELIGYFLPRYKSWSTTIIRPIILYFGWNAEDVSGFFLYSDKIPNYSLLSFNYRWYWESSWKPWIKMMNDIELIYKFTNSLNKEIIIVWRSVWTFFASYLGKYVSNVSRIVLITPFDKISDIVHENYSFFPIYTLLRYKFDNWLLLSQIDINKVWVFIASNDEIIPFESSQNLFDNLDSNTKDLFIIKNSTHNEIFDKKDFWDNLNLFLK